MTTQSDSSKNPVNSTAKSPAAQGLEGVVVADTRLSDVDGEVGKLIIAGHDVEALAGHKSFEELCALLFDNGATAHELRAALGRARSLAFSRLDKLGDALEAKDGMEALRAAMAHLRLSDADVKDVAEEVLVTGAMAVFAAAWMRRRVGQQPVAPDPELDHAADFLRMARGATTAVDAAEVAALAAYLVTVSDHGMNASTFTARVVASTGSDLVSAVVAAVGALKGPLHGGAPGPVLDMLDAIGSPEAATGWLEAELLAGRRIMGMGHRIYRVRDPRALVLEQATRALVKQHEKGGAEAVSQRLQLARAVEQAAEGVLRARHPNRPLHANVEFFTAVLLDALKLPREGFSTIFAVGRVAGWCAHVREQRQTGRLIRPASNYVGPQPAVTG